MKTAIFVVGVVCSMVTGVRAQIAPDKALVDRLHAQLTTMFSLAELPPLDAELRRQGEAIAAEHLARMRPVIERWVARERTQVPPDAPEWTLNMHGFAWLVNEVVTWRAESLGAEDDRLRRRQMAVPGACRHAQDLEPFAFLIVQLQGLPAADRERALALERERLARWGAPRTALPRWPEPLPDVQLEQALTEARQAEGRIVPPMVPALANMLVRDPAQSPLADAATRCETVRWWLQRQGDEPAALDLARLALLPQPPAPQVDRQRDDSGYPLVAARYGVQGRTTVTMQVDADGRVRDARVSDRALTVPGLQGQRPIAFETVFDALSLSRAAAMRIDDRRGQTHRVEFVWKLE